MDNCIGERILQAATDGIGIRRNTACTIEKDFTDICRQLLGYCGNNSLNTLLIVTDGINTHCLYTAGIAIRHLQPPLSLG